jgi:adenylate cyclase
VHDDRLPRKLAAILYADVVGYSRLTGEDEDATHRRLAQYLDLISTTVERHRGRVMHYAGDAVLATYGAVVDAVSSAVEIQQQLRQCNAEVPTERRVEFRIGVNLGDVIEDRGDVYGDGVNVAARLESLAAAGGICISEAVHTAVGTKLPLCYRFAGDQRVKNIERPVRAYHIDTPLSMTDDTTDSRTVRELTDKPSIAVLPFTNMSGDTEQEYFSDGISEDIITGLSRFHLFFVIARNSSFVYKGNSVDVKQVARDLGVQYVVEGSVRKAGSRVRITAQLIHAATDRHIWAERYDRALEDIFAVQDEISEAIITAVAPALASAEAQRAQRKAPENLDAWDYAMRGNWFLSRRGKDDIAEARRLFGIALEIDPNSTLALSGLAFALCWVSNLGFEGDRDAIRKTAYDAALRAIDLDDNDAWAHATMAFVFFTLRQLDAAIPEGKRALALNPNLAVAQSLLAISYSWRGDHELAVQHAVMAERLSPRDPAQSMWSFARACAEFGAGNYERALDYARKTTEAMPRFPGGWRYVVSSLGHLGRLDEARTAAEQLLQATPNESLQVVRKVLPNDRSERMERLIAGLRKAGVPEGDG